MRALKSVAKHNLRALVIDHHVLVRTGLKALIQEIDGKAYVMQAGNALDALMYIYDEPELDLVLLDIHMPDMDGFDLVKKIRATSERTKIIVISSVSDDGTIKRIQESGVTLYLPKDTSSTAIIQNIRSTLKCHKPMPTANRDNVAVLKNAEKRLSKRQLQIIQYMSQGMSNKEISQVVFLSEGTIKNHVTRIFSFLGVSNRTQAIIEAEKRKLIQKAK